MKWETWRRVIGYSLQCGNYSVNVELEDEERWSSTWRWSIWTIKPHKRVVSGTTHLDHLARRAALKWLKENVK